MRTKHKTNAPLVTDHSVLRYCERLLGFDIELIRRQILKSLPENALIDGKYPLIEGGKAVIKNNRIVTIID